MPKQIKKTIIFLIKIIGLTALLSFERVIGLPFIFTLLSFIWIDQVHHDSYSRPLLVLFVSFLMTVFYQAAWLLTILVWIISLLGMVYGNHLLKGKKRQFIILVIMQNLVWLWLLAIPASLTLLVQLIVSYLLIIIWLKLFRKKQINDKFFFKQRISS